jgi:ribonuclease HII
VGEEPTYVAGVDENGMGPRLGPLIVTMALARARGPKALALAQGKPPKSLAERLDDSKALVDFHASHLGEAWARAVLSRAGGEVTSPDALARALSLDDHERLTAPCPTHHAAQCWGTAGEALGASDELLAAVTGDLAKLAARGVEVVTLRSVIVCTRKLNEAAARGRTRFQVDLEAMERLVLHAREVAQRDVLATCGKVGGYDFYDDQFEHLAGHLRSTVCEGRARSEYRFPGVGSIAFVRDADAGHTLVALASLVGKWLRDALMRRVVRWYRSDDEALPDASGYHDPITARFVDATRLVREKRRVDDRCFERQRAQKVTSSAPRSPKEPKEPKPKKAATPGRRSRRAEGRRGAT